ncbi:MAG TPA: 50S ribosomal protein L16, partial [Candidatus Nanoarchaeia archaeon]|nr:50S ribosomal protein L16 [Candidatus Nanoarchaeia archaeon]
VSNRYLEKTLGKNYHLRLKVYPFHVLRENPLASGAGADRMSTGMKLSYGKTIGCAARIREGQTLFELRIDKADVKVGREALGRSATKLPCTCKVVVS